ncbi:MAG: hypothetical protein WAW13_03665 [Minisyncoccia bacterium]
MNENNQDQNATQAPVVQADNSTLMSVLAYIGILVLVPLLVSKDNETVKFHIKQGLVLLVIEAGVWVLGMMMWSLYPLLSIINIATLVLSIIGIVNVVQKKQSELPVVGQFAKHFTI